MRTFDLATRRNRKRPALRAAASVRTKNRERDLYDFDGADEQRDRDHHSADQEIFGRRVRWVHGARGRRGWLPRIAGDVCVAHGARRGVALNFGVAVWAVAHGEKFFEARRGDLVRPAPIQAAANLAGWKFGAARKRHR